MFVDTEGDIVAFVVEVVVQAVDILVRVEVSELAENIVGTQNNTTDRSVVYNSVAFHILDN